MKVVEVLEVELLKGEGQLHGMPAIIQFKQISINLILFVRIPIMLPFFLFNR